MDIYVCVSSSSACNCDIPVCKEEKKTEELINLLPFKCRGGNLLEKISKNDKCFCLFIYCS